MKIKCLVVIFVLVHGLLISCAGRQPEPKEYVHMPAGFKITMPGAWRKVNEDSEMYEFRLGDLKLVEVGSFSLDVDPEDLYKFSDEEFRELLRRSTLDGLDGYCDAATIRGYRIQNQYETRWGDRLAYRVQAGGYSTQALTSMIVDLVACVLEEKGRMYMFAAQIAEDDYPKVMSDFEAMITSFLIVQ